MELTYTSPKLVSPDDPVLAEIAHPVHNMEGQVVPYLSGMRKLMHASKGVGLAAPQIGLSVRFFVTNIDGAHTVVNPEIAHLGGSRVSALEGCLSKPGYRTFVLRYTELILRWVTPRWESREQLFTGHAARVLQHEIDHLNGVCIFPVTTKTPN